MTLYVDASALLKRYIEERDSEVAESLLATDPVLVTSRLTEVEVRRNLARLLDTTDALAAKRNFTEDLDAFALVNLDATTCSTAARIAEQTGCRSRDAIHLAAAQRAGAGTTLLTFDIRQAQAALISPRPMRSSSPPSHRGSWASHAPLESSPCRTVWQTPSWRAAFGPLISVPTMLKPQPRFPRTTGIRSIAC